MKRLAIISYLALQGAVAAEPVELTTIRSSYQKQIQTATAPINARYLEYLENLKKQLGGKGDVEGALAVQREIESIAGFETAKPTAENDRIVIWNQNNNGKGDRGTKRVSVSLYLGGREIWSRNSIKVEWDAVNLEKVEIPVPTMTADQLRVEITDTVNGKGGLSEVEFLRGGRNIALGGEVRVSAVWENNPKHAGTMLTDGIQTTYWLIPNDQDGWAEIALKP